MVRLKVKKGGDIDETMTYNQYVNMLIEAESGMPVNVRLSFYYWVNDLHGQTGTSNYMEYPCQISWARGIKAGDIMNYLWPEVHKHCTERGVEVCKYYAKTRHFYMFHSVNTNIQSAKDWDHVRIIPIPPENDDKWDSTLEFWQHLKHDDMMRLYKGWFSKKPRKVQFRRKNTKFLQDTYLSCTFHAVFVTPKHAVYLNNREQRIIEDEMKMQDASLARLTFPIKGCSFNSSTHHSNYHSLSLLLLPLLTLTHFHSTYFCSKSTIF